MHPHPQWFQAMDVLDEAFETLVKADHAMRAGESLAAEAGDLSLAMETLLRREAIARERSAFHTLLMRGTDVRAGEA